MHFYKSTRTFLGFPTNPVVHRSLVFTLASSDEHQTLLEEVAEDKAMINRPRRGETPPIRERCVASLGCALVGWVPVIEDSLDAI